VTIVCIEIREIAVPEATTDSVTQQRDLSGIDMDSTFLVNEIAKPIEL
jgi:hypothetical protein